MVPSQDLNSRPVNCKSSVVPVAPPLAEGEGDKFLSEAAGLNTPVR